MKPIVTVALFLAASLFIVSSPAMAESGPKNVPVPIAGAGLLGFAGLVYLGRKLRRRH